MSKSPGDNERHDLYAAVDLGSNSFHLLIAEWIDGRLRVVDAERDMVRLGAGLDKNGNLGDEAIERALQSLRRFRDRMRHVPRQRVRAVGTNTLRVARNAGEFLRRAQVELGHPVEVISGDEEARLIYAGVARSLEPIQGRQLVVGIGGGSTECVLGEGLEVLVGYSLPMGCVSFTQELFPDGTISEERLRAAVSRAASELASIEARFFELGWTRAIGASGTIQAVQSILRAQGWETHAVTRGGLNQLQRALIDVGHVDRLDFDGLSERRRPVLVGGMAVLGAIFQRFKLDEMQVSDSALREGLIYELSESTKRQSPCVQPTRQRDLSDIAGNWKPDKATDDALAEQRRIDPDLWK